MGSLVGVGVLVGVFVSVGVGVNVGVKVGVAVGVFVGVFVGVLVGVEVGVKVGVGVAAGTIQRNSPASDWKSYSCSPIRILPTARTVNFRFCPKYPAKPVIASSGSIEENEDILILSGENTDNS